MDYQIAGKRDLGLLAELNHQLIEDEGHSNPMTAAELQDRLRGWLARTYTAVLFTVDSKVVGYALYRSDGGGIFLRQFLILRGERRKGFGRAAMELLVNRVWPRPVVLTVEALAANRAAIEFWRSIGFEDYALTLRRRTSLPEPAA